MPFDLVSIGLALVLSWWTIRLARNKGRKSAWIWGALAFLLAIPSEPWRLLGMVPLFVLLFIRNPVPKVDAPPIQMNCARCKAKHPASQRYCISCGWELARSYSDTIATGPQEETAQTVPGQPAVSAKEVGAPQETPAATEIKPDTGAPSAPEPVQSPEPVLASQQAQSEAQPAAPGSETPGSEHPPEPETAPKTPVFRGQPTAANMTERGIWLFNQGRIQESIDQFTKALALDVNFKEAWEHRAEAYSRLGRGEQAAEDRRRLQAINAGSSSS